VDGVSCRARPSFQGDEGVLWIYFHIETFHVKTFHVKILCVRYECYLVDHK